MFTKNKNILLIDDEKHFRDSIRFFLEDCDYTIFEAENGRIGTEKIQEYQPDLILMDLYMPEMTGLDVLAWAKEQEIDIPIVIISGAGEIHDVAEALRLGAWDYIFKPIEDLSVLEYGVSKALERAALIQENRNYQLHLEDEVEKRTQALKQVNTTLLQNQQRIERANIEEQVLGQMLKLCLETKNENDFLAQALKIITKQISWKEHSAEGALFIKPCDIDTLQLVDWERLSDEHYEQCLNKEFGQDLFKKYCNNAFPKDAVYPGSYLNRDQSNHYFCVIPVYLKESTLSILLFYYPDNYHVDEKDRKFMTRISDILSMGVVKFDAEKEVQYLAYHDALTGLPNRCMLLSRLEQDIAVAQRHGWHGALIFVDLDRFKYLNDALGHIIGDELLKQVAKRLTTLMRSEDMIARLGGDEFVVLLLAQETYIKDVIYNAQNVAEKIGRALSQPYILEKHDYFITASLGISLFPMEGESSTDLLKHADTAMYRAKAEGGNTSQFYKPEMQKAADKRLSVEKDLRKALLNDELELYFQPQVLINENRIVGSEALLRWIHPERGFVSPADFIPVAEETGIILEVGEWVLRSAIKQMKQWEEHSYINGFKQLAINVSPLQFRQASFVELIEKILSENKLSPGRIKIELTEGTIIDNVEDIIHKMQRLKELGVCFSLDDFGTGYSSLSYLKRLPIDQLKIDQSFIKDIAHDENDVAIVETIIAMGNHLGLDVIAEGVESEREIKLLKEKGCMSYQGYYFSKAVCADEFEQLLRSQEADVSSKKVV